MVHDSGGVVPDLILLLMAVGALAIVGFGAAAAFAAIGGMVRGLLWAGRSLPCSARTSRRPDA